MIKATFGRAVGGVQAKGAASIVMDASGHPIIQVCDLSGSPPAATRVARGVG